MLKLSQVDGRLTCEPLTAVNLQQQNYSERYDLQQMIVGNFPTFWEDAGENKLLLIGQEICPDEDVNRRIDILAIDEDGAPVIIELKKGKDYKQHLQAISYAAMVAKWDLSKFAYFLSSIRNQNLEDSSREIVEFVEGSLADEYQFELKPPRIVLVAEEYAYETLATVEWMRDRYLDIRCYKIEISIDGGQEYLGCSCAYPPPALKDISEIKARRSQPVPWSSIKEALEGISSSAIKDLFSSEIREDNFNLRSRSLIYKNTIGKICLKLIARSSGIGVLQKVRFDGDEDFYNEQFDKPDISERAGGDFLYFNLSKESDIQRLAKILRKELLPRLA